MADTVYDGKWNVGMKEGARVSDYHDHEGHHILNFGHGECTIRCLRQETPGLKRITWKSKYSLTVSTKVKKSVENETKDAVSGAIEAKVFGYGGGSASFSKSVESMVRNSFEEETEMTTMKSDEKCIEFAGDAGGTFVKDSYLATFKLCCHHHLKKKGTSKYVGQSPTAVVFNSQWSVSPLGM